MPAYRLHTIVCAAIALFATSMVAHAAQTAYPTRPIRLIVAYPPGGSADPLARTFGAWYADKLGVPVIADNRPGASTTIAHTLGARAAPDGHTLLMASSTGLATNVAVGMKTDYVSLKDFAFISMTAHVPHLLVVHTSMPAKTMSELIELTRSQPGKIIIGSPGAGTPGHLAIELLNVQGGAKFMHLPYKGIGPAIIDVLGNRIQGAIGSVAGSQPQIAAGRVRAIATSHFERLRSMPSVPAIAETIPGYTGNAWYGLVAPAGTPAAIVEKLNAETKRAAANPELARHIEALGMEVYASTPQEFRAWVQTEIDRWTKVVREARITLQ